MIRNMKTFKSHLLFVLLVLCFAGGHTPVMAEEVTQQFNGLTLNANLVLAEGQTLEDPIAVILHGIMGHNKMEVIESTQRALFDNDYSSLAFNLSLGLDNRKGFFDCEAPHQHTVEGALTEIQAWIDWLKSQGTTQIILMAHSRSEVLIYAALMADPAIFNVVVLAPAIYPARDRFTDRYGNNFEDTRARMEAAAKQGKGRELVAGVDFFFCPQATVMPDTWLSYYGKDSPYPDLAAHIPNLPVRTLIIFGTEDEVIVDGHESVNPLVDNETVFMFIVDGAGHFFLDFNIDEAMEAAIEFIS